MARSKKPKRATVSMERRHFLRTGGLAGAAALVAPAELAGAQQPAAPPPSRPVAPPVITMAAEGSAPAEVEALTTDSSGSDWDFNKPHHWLGDAGGGGIDRGEIGSVLVDPNIDYAIFRKAGCYQCHSEQAQGGAQGPRLGPNPIAFQAFARYLRAPSGEMPPYTAKVMSDQEVTDVYAFLRALPPAPPLSSLPLLQP